MFSTLATALGFRQSQQLLEVPCLKLVGVKAKPAGGCVVPAVEAWKQHGDGQANQLCLGLIGLTLDLPPDQR